MGKAVAIAATASATRRVSAVMIGMMFTLLCALSLSAFAQPAPPPGPAERGPGMGLASAAITAPGWGSSRLGRHRHGMGGGHHGMDGGGMMFGGSPERMGRMIDHMLDGLNASDAQRSQIKQIAAAAGGRPEGAARGRRAALRERGMQVFTAPNVDADAAEQVRQQMLAQHDQASRRMMQAMLDVSRVLTPEQRAKTRRAHARAPGADGRSHAAHGRDAPVDAAREPRCTGPAERSSPPASGSRRRSAEPAPRTAQPTA